MTKLSVNINEISDYKRTLEWEGQDTKLARLISLAVNLMLKSNLKYLNEAVLSSSFGQCLSRK